jgi:hypothetical protein
VDFGAQGVSGFVVLEPVEMNEAVVVGVAAAEWVAVFLAEARLEALTAFVALAKKLGELVVLDHVECAAAAAAVVVVAAGAAGAAGAADAVDGVEAACGVGNAGIAEELWEEG